MPIANTKEYIKHKASSPDDWICSCGNEPASDGFYACDENGNEIEPTPEHWKQPLYVCGRCGRIIHQETMEVVGKQYFPHLLQ